ncbi:MAG TPA: ABC transporter ATP-binding protein [Alphaproteobacteria bacterium]|nr:ABC transporter ATP-binding protein [Alphaproteobacteria bacterium]
MSSITLAGINKRFGQTTALHDLSLEVGAGEFFVILGPSGAGKTTTLRVIAGLERPDSGRVAMDGIDVTGRHTADRDVAFVFQQYSLYPHLSVRENMAFPLKAPGRNLTQAEIDRRIGDVAALLHIEAKLDRPTTRLSGGEMQRVAIGRALVRRPRAFLMDEPLSSLDAKLREELRVELKRIQQRLGATVVYVTHDQVEALTLADRIAVLDGGRVHQIGTPEEVYGRPDTLDVALRLGTPPINVLPPAWFEGGLPQGADRVAIRPEDVECFAGDAIRIAEGPLRPLACTVVECSPLSRTLVAERETVEIRAILPDDRHFAPGERVRLAFPPDRRQYFDRQGRRLG